MKATPLFLLLLSVCQTSVHSRASCTITSSQTQYFEYETVALICEQASAGEWTVWRYTTKRPKLSRCGVGWGNWTSSTCYIDRVKLPDIGVYWCESKHRESSNVVNITATGGSVILQSPVLPVVEGQSITLSCETKTSSDLAADFYRNDSLIGRGPRGHMTVHRFSQSDEGPYKCKIGKEDSPTSWLLMKADNEPVLLMASPDSSQLFPYRNMSLSCSGNGSFRGWKVIRSTTPTPDITAKTKMSTCGAGWGTPTSVGCRLGSAKQTDNAIYWCESPARQRSNSINITVYNTPVILQTPVLPVMEGHQVKLSCKTNRSSSLPAHFYRDGSLVSTEPTGHMTIHHVSKSDEGLYTCTVSGGKSPPSWLFVEEGELRDVADSTISVARVICHLVVFCPYCISTVLMVRVYRHRPAGRKQRVSMATPPPREDDEELDQPYDDVTTEHHF